MRFLFYIVLLLCTTNLRAQHITDLYKLQDAEAMDSVFRSYSPAVLRDCVSISQLDDLRSYIAASYAFRHDILKVDDYVNQLQYGPEKGNQYFRIARSFENANDPEQAARFAKLAADSVMSYLHVQGPGVTPVSILASSLVLLTAVLEKQQKYEEAITWLTDRIGYCSERNRPGLLSLKGDMQVKAAKYKDALDTYTAVLKARAGGTVVAQKMKQAYIALHRADTTGFENYLAGIKARIAHEFSDSIRKSTVRVKAPLFELKDLDGNVVKLADYLGKVVILDFWATWCVPCKASFPTMQRAIEQYAPDQSVVFLFIDTWEYKEDMDNVIKEFLEKKHYTFRVLRDRKDEVVKQYGVDGIPAKFIIDKKGYIRFSLKGNNGSIEEALGELAEMITLSR